MDYSSKTVAQLKEILKGKGLSTAGVKSELIQRLKEAPETEAGAIDDEELLEEVSGDENKQENGASEKSKDQIVETAKEPEPEKVDATTTASETGKQVEKTEEKDETPVIKATPEEMKKAAIDLLTTRLNRAQKFQDEASIKTVEQEIRRVEKFGVALNTQLAVELGFSKPERPKPVFQSRKNFHKKGKFNKKKQNRVHK
ncbi:RNA-binding protein [Komagataella phaffii CBS 7435]|uniref:Conserved nuclear RNA-binding protein n=2 Tax=Komagataella phaffii TaxID=460519 RepID=C4QY55_KOMPG|nr:Conserved nuclear RNA-binding protein [Komagataella phaffii GS115]AOA60464.1 GQ67_01835T0 [Komagataella phaffii]CAH2446998.1 RNA-binding protein [Komagataella phaffii CBS 7435]AOA65499.1 GQ68_01850T0 [Komagataella phaffii GS115]CAY68178.1 Conserved nuclear RNA-binding protein [Komagataella phaffii GS115]CCA37251.1 RNA-binding protein [Komagataella phaffii CBS 7435]